MKVKDINEILSPVQRINVICYSDINDLQSIYYGEEIIYKGFLGDFYKSKYFKTGFWGEKAIDLICCGKEEGYLNIFVK